MTESEKVANAFEQAVIDSALERHATAFDRYTAIYQRDVVQIALRAVRNATLDDPRTHEQMRGMLHGLVRGVAAVFAMYVPAESHLQVVRDFEQLLAHATEGATLVYADSKVRVVR